jgi:CheY-like chemotaxis protein
MAMFGMKKAKPSEGSELVLAYLEEAQRVRTTLVAIDPKGREVPATLVAVTEERVTLAAQGRVMAEKGEPVRLLFCLDGLRFQATGKVIELKNSTLLLDLPGSIELAERRKRPRARLNQREGATAIALTGLFEGIGLTGTIDNISEGGMCLKVGRAMNVKTQGPMHLGPNLISVGEVFMLIKLNKLPKCPLIEVGGLATHVASDGGLLSVGISFEAGKDSLLGPVKSLVASRASAIPTAVPPKARRVQEPKPAPGEAPIELAPPRPVAVKAQEPTPPPSVVAPELLAPEPVRGAASPPASASLPEQPEVTARGSALLRMKKRSRGVLLAMPEGPDRRVLAAYLANDGYGRVRAAATLTELLAFLGEVDLVFVDGGVAELQGLALASLIRQRLEDGETPILLAETSVDTDLVLGANEAGVAQVIVKPYDLDQDFLRMFEGHLGLG